MSGAENREKSGEDILRMKAVYSELPAVNTPLCSIDDVYNYMEYEAELIIEYGDRVFFCEEVAIVEFYWYISRWYNAVSSSEKANFAYSTVEHTKPILTFTRSGDKTWVIDSIWGKGSPVVVGERDLFEQAAWLTETLGAMFKSDKEY